MTLFQRRNGAPIRLYLDSSDYSLLSDPVRGPREAPGVLEAIRGHLESGRVECFFSGAHLSEMAPLEPQFAQAAESRAELLVHLCGRKCLLSHDRLFLGEVRFAAGAQKSLTDPVSRTGEWFPEGATELLPISELEQVASVRQAIKGLGRADRRKAEKALLKGGRPKRFVREQVLENARGGPLDEILAMYPMNPEAARTLSKFIAGDASAEEASNAFGESLRDPRWMMQWFRQHHEKMDFLRWVRAPADEIVAKLLELSDLFAKARADLVTAEQFAELTSAKRWRQWQDEMVTSLASRFAADAGLPGGFSAAQVDQCCPGLSTAVRTVHSAWNSIIQERPRKPRPSDFADAMHAAFSPYMDVFRADAFMAPHVAAQTPRFGTLVVRRLSELPAALDKRLAAAS